MMNKQHGNMYPWCNYTWNPIRGECTHDCKYCYMHSFPVGELRLEEKELVTDLGKDNTIFVGSSVDMWAEEVPREWIEQVLDHCKRFDNTYLFQTKNPKRFRDFEDLFPKKIILGVTIETNRDYRISGAPSPARRFIEMPHFADTMISLEPLLDFDVGQLLDWLKVIKPRFVSIGADSKHHDLPEPSKDKIEELIKLLKISKIDIKLKSNLKRLMK